MMMPVAFQLARRTGTPALRHADADGVRLAARRHRDAGRHLAQHHRLARARGNTRRSPSACSTSRRSVSLLAIGGVAFLAFGWRLLPERKGAASMDAAFNLEGYTTEVVGAGELRIRRQDGEGSGSAGRGRGRSAGASCADVSAIRPRPAP